MMKDKLETDTFSRNCKGDIKDLIRTSCTALQSLQSVIEVHTGLPHRSQATWDRMGYGSHDVSQISSQLQDSVNLANDINRELEEWVLPDRRNLQHHLLTLLPDIQ
jgi:hypothetical protein